MKFLIPLLFAVAAAAADPLAVETSADGAFLVVSEFVVLEALPEVPAAIAERPWCGIVDYLTALGAQKAPFELSNDMAGALVARVAGNRWLVVNRYRSFVRPAAIAVIDERTASGLLAPPTPAPGADPAQPLVAPIAQASGVTIAAGTARLFCGVRSNGRSLAVGQKDLAALAALVRVPTAEALAATVARSLPGR